MKKLYVGNLPYAATKEGIETLFSQYGKVIDVVLITDRETGRAKGFGFVEFETEEDAQKALELDSKDYEGRPLKVNMAKPRESGGSRGAGGGRY